ncbi:MAG: hypothetical protein PHF24_10160 [Syntrophomonas sp.]|nr:hypothetical protein [Syntrophomonas sp.]
MSNFSFLDESWADAGRVVKKAEDILHQDPSAAIQHLRKFGGMLTKIIFKNEYLVETERSTQFDRLAILEEKGIIPDEIKNKFHSIRKAGNDAIYEDRATIGRAVANLELAYEISVWAYQTYDNASYQAADFKIPPREKNSNTNERIVSEKSMNPPIPNMLINGQEKSNNPSAAVKESQTNPSIKEAKALEMPLPTNQKARDHRKKERQPGDISIKNQELIERTDVHSKSKPQQYIWILRCNDCSNIYGANGADFHERNCPKCHPKAKQGEPIEWWIERHGRGNDVEKKSGDKPDKTPLHEAMRIVLAEADNGTMFASELADQIFRRALYKKKDGNKALYKQILLRCKNYPDLFDVTPGKYIKLKGQ